MALLDWEHDGDLDLCVANRNGPQLRLLRNDFPSPGHFLALRLRGTSCNRDAIGARVEVFPKGQPAPLVRSVRAGDAFLSQSTKWLHLGLGDAADIERLVVHWPGAGEPEQIAPPAVDARYTITEGTGKAEPAPARHHRPPASSIPFEPHPATQRARTFTHAPIPTPPLRYQRSADGEESPVQIGTQPVLINLWASWCAPCVTELKAFTAEAPQIRGFGLDILALSIETGDTEPDNDARFLTELGWPFRSGRISTQETRSYQRLHDFVFDLHEPLPIPSSFLLDGGGNLQAIFKGPVEVGWLLENVARLVELPQSGEGRAAATLPFPGRWFAEPRRLNYIDLALSLAQDGPLDDAIAYSDANGAAFMQSPRAPRLLFALGAGLAGERRFAEAETRYRAALRAAPTYIDALEALARLLATRPQLFPGTSAEAVDLAGRAAKSTRFRNAQVMDTLAAAQANRGLFTGAANSASTALTLARESGEQELTRQIEARLRLYQERQPYLEP